MTAELGCHLDSFGLCRNKGMDALRPPAETDLMKLIIKFCLHYLSTVHSIWSDWPEFKGLWEQENLAPPPGPE